VVVILPAAAAASGLPNSFGAANAGGLPLFGQQASNKGAVEALPLPQEQAFAFEAIAYDGNQLLLRLTPAPGYYLYRDRTTMKLEGAKGLSLDRPRWPRGTAHRDEHFGDVVVYFSQAEVPVPLIRSHGDAAQATLKVTFQGCQKDGICYPPMTRAVKLAIPEGNITAAATTGEARAPELIAPLPTADANANATSPATDADVVVGTVAGEALPRQIARTTPPADVLRKANAASAPTGVFVALLLALAGGLILNLMPCVLPVLSLKALSLADGGRGGGHARRSALWYTAGVLLSFIALGALAIGLRAAGQALGWGFQLQQPLVIGALVYLMFAVGLSLSGVFALGHRFAGAAGAGAPPATRNRQPDGDRRCSAVFGGEARGLA
jgi:thiol:disulfide interchange protein DsbD